MHRSCNLYAANASKWSTSTNLIDRDAFDRYVASNKIMPIFHPAVIMKKSVVREVGGYRPDYRLAEDMDLWNRIAERGYLILIQPEHLLYYRIHTSSASVASTREQFQKLDWVTCSTAYRRMEQPEPSFEEYLQSLRSGSFVQRLRRSRKLWAQVFYKRSTALYISWRKLRAVPFLIASILLATDHTLSRASDKVIGKLWRFVRTHHRDASTPRDVVGRP